MPRPIPNPRISRYDCGSVKGPDLKLKYQSYNVTPDELFDLFGKFGPIRYVYSWTQQTCRCSRAHCPYLVLTILTSPSQVRQGIANNSKGTAFVVYEDVMDAKQACDKLNGFNFQNRYLVGM